MNSLTFVVLTWNRYRFVEKCLEALIGSLDDPSRCQILVADNGSTDATAGVLRRYEGSSLVSVTTLDRNYGLSPYKKLFGQAKSDYIVVVDDDVLEFPQGLDTIFVAYMEAFPKYGLLGLNVVQNEHTNGSKPGPEQYTEETSGGKTILRGPTGGWCACFRRSDYRKLRWLMMLLPLSMKRGEDAFLTNHFRKRLGLESGLIRDAVCLHASGPYYAELYGHLDREIEKYEKAGMGEFAAEYRKDRS